MSRQPNELPGLKWWVFFQPSTRPRRWWYRLIPGYSGPFQHCFAACEVSENTILLMDPKVNGMWRGFILGRPAEHIRFAKKAGMRVLFIEFEQGRPDMFLTNKINNRGLALTCASIIAYELGLSSWAVTPKGLFRVLTRRYGATEV